MLAALDEQLIMKQVAREKEKEEHIQYGKQIAKEIEQHNKEVKMEKEKKKLLKKKHHEEILKCMKEEAMKRLTEASEVMPGTEHRINSKSLGHV